MSHDVPMRPPHGCHLSWVALRKLAVCDSERMLLYSSHSTLAALDQADTHYSDEEHRESLSHPYIHIVVLPHYTDVRTPKAYAMHCAHACKEGYSFTSKRNIIINTACASHTLRLLVTRRAALHVD